MTARLGYLGTACRALKRGNVGPGKRPYQRHYRNTEPWRWRPGARQIPGTARDESLFERVMTLAEPGRIEILKSGSQSVREWSKQITACRGVDVVIDALSLCAGQTQAGRNRKPEPWGLCR